MLLDHSSPDDFQKGICYATWCKEGFSSSSSDQSLREIARTGANYVQIVVTYYQKRYDSTAIKPIEDRTPSDDSVIHAIVEAHKNGMAVMLKPHIDVIDDTDGGRADIGFVCEKDWNAWFDNYSKFLKHYAVLAKKYHVELFCIGTELSYAQTRTEAWRKKVIPLVRSLYSGRITYAANWDAYDTVKFWDLLDFAGIDAYFPLANKDNPTIDELVGAWEKWAQKIEAWYKSVGKAIIFTECGYCSTSGAAKRPWEESYSGDVNLALQADCYRALMKTFWNKAWFQGLYWWGWSTYSLSGKGAHKKFTPQNKPAVREVKSWYSNSRA
ncbi:MAG: hypothetical protein PHS37_05915 [Candidatus Omnitrophica bacterium]|nr:hypothetical protein [Candidatus Omnitrophota bacterium]